MRQSSYRVNGGGKRLQADAEVKQLAARVSAADEQLAQQQRQKRQLEQQLAQQEQQLAQQEQQVATLDTTLQPFNMLQHSTTCCSWRSNESSWGDKMSLWRSSSESISNPACHP